MNSFKTKKYEYRNHYIIKNSNETVFAQNYEDKIVKINFFKQLYQMKLQEKKDLNQEINDLEQQYKSFLLINYN